MHVLLLQTHDTATFLHLTKPGISECPSGFHRWSCLCLLDVASVRTDTVLCICPRTIHDLTQTAARQFARCFKSIDLLLSHAHYDVPCGSTCGHAVYATLSSMNAHCKGCHTPCQAQAAWECNMITDYMYQQLLFYHRATHRTIVCIQYLRPKHDQPVQQGIQLRNSICCPL